MSEQRSWLQTLVVLVAIAAAVGVTLYTLRPGIDPLPRTDQS